MDLCFFTADGETLTPTDVARSLWSAEQMHGVAISGAMARGLERAVHRDDLRPARYTLDMFRPARMEPFSVHTRVVRGSRRICLVDAEIVQGDQPCARAAAVFLAVTEDPDGSVWRPASSEAPSPPPAEVTPELTGPTIPWYASDEPWGQDFLAHQNSGRKTNRQYGVPVVAGEQPTPFQAVASMADSTTMVCNWGTRGVQYINTDITLSLSRLPRTPEVGLRAADWTGHDGIAVGHGHRVRPGGGHRHVDGHRHLQQPAHRRLRRARVHRGRDPDLVARMRRGNQCADTRPGSHVAAGPSPKIWSRPREV